MFTQAGFNTNAKVIAAALIRRRGRSWQRWSFLARWPGGDLAFLGDQGASWPHQVVIVNHVAPSYRGWSADLPRSVLPQ